MYPNRFPASFLLLFLFLHNAYGQTIADIDKACYKSIAVPGRPDFLTADGDDVWVIDDNNSLIRRIGVDHDKPVLTVAVSGACAAPVAAAHAVWVMSCAEKMLYKIDANSGKVMAKIPTGVADPNGEMSLAVGDGSVWLLSDSTGILLRINPETATVQATIRVQPHSYCAAYADHAVWVTSTGNSAVQRIDSRKNSVVAVIPAGKNPRFIAVDGQAVWTLNQGDGTVTRIDPQTNQVVATIDVQAKGPGGDIAAGDGKVWIVSTNISRPVQTINTATNQIETIYSQTAGNDQTAGEGTLLRVDGAVRTSAQFIWVSGLYRQKVWVFKK